MSGYVFTPADVPQHAKEADPATFQERQRKLREQSCNVVPQERVSIYPRAVYVPPPPKPQPPVN